MNTTLKIALTTSTLLLPLLATAQTPAEDSITSTINDVISIQSKLQSELNTATLNRDSIKFSCISDKLQSIKNILTQITTRQQAISSNPDPDNTSHNLLIINELHNHATRTQTEATFCLGADIIRIGDEQTLYEVTDSMVSPSLDYPTTSSITEPPNCASCFR